MHKKNIEIKKSLHRWKMGSFPLAMLIIFHSSVGFAMEEAIMKSPADSLHHDVTKALSVEVKHAKEGGGKAPETISSVALQTQDKYLDMEEAIRLAVQRHPSVESALQSVYQFQGQVDAAKAAKQLQVSAGLKAGNEGGSLLSSSQNVNLGLSVYKSLYDFGKIDSDIFYAEARKRYMQASYLVQVDEIAYKTAISYLNVLRYQAYLKEADIELEAIRKLLDMTELRARAGVSSFADVVQANSRLASAEADRANIVMQLLQEKIRMQMYVGFVTDNMKPVPVELAKFNAEKINLPLQSLPQFQQAMADFDAAEADLKKAQAQRYPTIGIQGDFSRALTGINLSSGEEKGSESAIYLSVTKSLFGDGAPSKIIAAKSGKAAALKKAEAVKLETEIASSAYKEQMQGNRDILKLINIQCANINAAKDLYLDQYMLGTRSILDLLNVEEELYRAAVQKQRVQFDIFNATVNYIKDTGQMRTVFNIGEQKLNL